MLNDYKLDCIVWQVSVRFVVSILWMYCSLTIPFGVIFWRIQAEKMEFYSPIGLPLPGYPNSVTLLGA